MRRLVIGPSANDDQTSICDWSERTFGLRARVRYESLIVQAMLDLAENPERHGVEARPEISSRARTNRLFFSRMRVPQDVGIVKQPRHLLLFRVATDGSVEISRILHERMDLGSQVPPEFLD